jgi:glycosyltransferase involved in cell wall biosynthesis
MRVMVVAPPWLRIPPEGYGGIELVVGVLVDQLVARGHDVTLVASGGSTSTGRVRSPLGEPPPPAVLGDAWVEGTHALSAYREAAGLDVIHDHGGVFGPALASAMPVLPPVVHTLHGPWTPNTRAFYRLVHRDVHLVAISEAQRRDNPEVDYAGTVHDGIDMQVYRLAEEEDRGEELVYIGRANAGKNPDGAIRVARTAGRS